MRGSSPRQSEGRPTRWYDEPCPAAPLRIAAWHVLDSNLFAGLSDQGQCPRNAFSLGISLLSIARCYSRVVNG